MRSALPTLALPLLLCACIPDADGFDEAFLETWCTAWQEQCEGVLDAAPCRGTGAPTTSINPPNLDDCAYHRGKAGQCLEVDKWSCEAGEDGQPDVLVPPAACDEVWTCP